MFTLQEALEAIKDKPEFVARDRDFGVVIDYNVTLKETFVGKTDRESGILKNLRGTCFDKAGNISRLPYHKFMNLNENEEYHESKYDFADQHVIHEKLDGSMIAPIKFPDGSWDLGTRAGVTDVAKKAIAFLVEMSKTDRLKYLAYYSFITECVESNITPIFEYCARDQRIVIDYIDSKLVLTGVRFNETGTYVQNLSSFLIQFGSSEDDFGLIDTVREVYTSRAKIAEFAKVVNDLQGEEGVVVKFVDGRYVKIKASDYVMKHRALDGLRFEKDVLRLVLENSVDDVLPLVTPDMKVRLESYRDSVLTNIKAKDSYIDYQYAVWEALARGDRKHFASYVNGSKLAPFMFAKYSGKDGSVTSYLKKHLSSQTAIDEAREYIGKSWESF